MRRAFFLLALSTALAGCTSAKLGYAWLGFEEPQEQDLMPTTSDEYCPTVGVQNLSPQRQRAIIEATAAVCAIMRSAEFRDALRGEDWIARCQDANRQIDRISGPETYAAFERPLPDFSVHPRRPWSALAQAYPNAGDGLLEHRIAIDPARIRLWYNRDPQARAELVNSVAHEMTHLVSTRFQDYGHGADGCERDELVSYAVGDLVAELWLAANRDATTNQGGAS